MAPALGVSEPVERTRAADGSRDLRLAPLAVALIFVVTAVPLEVRAHAEWQVVFGARDILQNLVLFAPLGIALRRWPLWKLAGIAAGLSLSVEVAQLWSMSRHSSLVDIASNTGGAVLAALLSRRGAGERGSGGPVRVRLTRWRVGMAVVLAATVVGLWALPVQRPQLTAWDSAARINLGNEVTGDRGWRGTLSAVELRVPADTARPPDLAFRDTTERVFDGTKLERLPESVGHALFAATRANQSFAVSATITPAWIHHDASPTTIMSYSHNASLRNFVIEQDDVRIRFRVHTSLTTPDGRRARAVSVPVLELGRASQVLATFDGEVARIFVDGRLVARSSLAAAGCMSRPVCDAVAPPAWALLGVVLGMLTLLAIPGGSLGADVARVNLAAVLGVFATTLLPAFPVAAGTYGHLPPLALLGATCVALSWPRSGSVAAR